MAKFVYRGSERTADSIARKSKEGTRDYDSCFTAGVKMFKAKEGENCVRILPGTFGEPDWDLIVYSHWDIGADGGRYLCPAKMKGEACAVCDTRAKVTDSDEADKLSPVKGAICWVVDRDAEKEGPQLWNIPFTKVRNEIHTRSVDKKTRAPILVDDPEEGYDIVFNRKGTDQHTTYSGVEVVRDPSPLHEDPKVQERWLSYVTDNPLDKVLNFYDYDYVEKVLLGQATKKAAAADDDDEVEVSRPVGRRRPVVTPEPEEDTAEQAPPPRRRLAAPVQEDEDPPAADSRAARRRALLADSEPEADDDPPFDPDTGEIQEDVPPARASRAAANAETAVATARRSLERLKPRR